MPNAREKSGQDIGIYAHPDKDAGRKTYAQDSPIDRGKVRGVGAFGGEAGSMVQPLDDVAALGPSPRPSPRGRGGRLEGRGSGLERGGCGPERGGGRSEGGGGGPGERGSGEDGRRRGASIATLSPALMSFARQLRRDQTDAERLLWRLLRNQRFCGLKFRRQHPIEPYVLDFYCHEERLGIELDGGQHAAPDTQHSDTARTAFLESKGITIVRFWNTRCCRIRKRFWSGCIVRSDPHPRIKSRAGPNPLPVAPELVEGGRRDRRRFFRRERRGSKVASPGTKGK